MRLKRTPKLLNLPFSSNNKQLPSLSNKLRRPNLLSNKQRRLESPKKSKIRSIVRMQSLLLCKRPKRKLRHLLRLPGRRLKKKPN